jgi:hypothetical protein
LSIEAVFDFDHDVGIVPAEISENVAVVRIDEIQSVPKGDGSPWGPAVVRCLWFVRGVAPCSIRTNYAGGSNVVDDLVGERVSFLVRRVEVSIDQFLKDRTPKMERVDVEMIGGDEDADERNCDVFLLRE